MKMRNDYMYYHGLCCGCNAAVKQEEVDPDKLYLQLLCWRCREELEHLPLRHKTTFDKLKREMETVAGKVKFLEGKITILEGFIVAHGLNPQEAGKAVPSNGVGIPSQSALEAAVDALDDFYCSQRGSQSFRDDCHAVGNWIKTIHTNGMDSAPRSYGAYPDPD